MTVAESIKKSVLGDKSTDTIKSGTLVTTRGTGVIAVGLIGTFMVLDAWNASPWQGLPPEGKLNFILATGAIWALVIAADSIARGLATRSSLPAVVTLPAGLSATRITGKDTTGWSVLAVQVSGTGQQEAVQYLVVRGGEAAWVGVGELQFPSV